MSDDNQDKKSGSKIEIVYDDDSTRLFMIASIIWGLVGMLVGVICAFQQLNFWQMNGKVSRASSGSMPMAWNIITFGRLQTAPHQRGYLRFRRKHDVCRGLLFDPAIV